MTHMRKSCVSIFLSTLSLRRATRNIANGKRKKDISIHALLAESDHHLSTYRHQGQQFLSTLSLRRATHAPSHSLYLRNISIHALLAESDSSIEEVSKYVVISIHALLAESDASPKP